MGKLDGKVAVITAATSGMALATAKLFVQEGAYVFITGRRQEKLDEAVKAIVMNGSIASVKGMPGRSVYGASKAALRSFARTWLVELTERKIRVNVMSPGPIDTPALENAPPEMIEQFRSMIPRKELGRPEEIATAVLFLASDDSSFVNGSELSVDGGLAQI
jgi:NAD(P)-dependent dehydrogenase (short-subunit alcohol dehydrogenase family)